MSLYLSGNLTIFKKLGVYGRILGSNFELSVEDQDKPINSQLGSLSIGLSYIFSPKIKSNVYQVGFATGVTSRHILGDLKFDSNKPYRESILGFTDPSLTSWEYSLYVRANNNIYYFVRYADFQLGKNIDGVSRELKGFSDGRFCFGVSASGDFFRF
ncbi:MAG: hypothetical protein DWQ10_18735 [Calditrichaeota bacterium]|nr:MAG: hypothetical protein DWQ10_18735 [Calditrichota bacterium]